jgi:hypothetical protein
MPMGVLAQGRHSAALRPLPLSIVDYIQPVLSLKSTFNIVELMDEKSIHMKVTQIIGFRLLRHILENPLPHFPSI